MTHWERLKLRWKCWRLDICPKHAEHKEYVNAYWRCRTCHNEWERRKEEKRQDRARQQRAMIQFLETQDGPPTYEEET